MSRYMKKEIKKEIKEYLNINAIDTTSLFGVYMVNVNTYEIEYINQSVKNMMADLNGKYCWEAMYGLDAPCPWCKIPQLVNENKKSNEQNVMFELFNEVNDKWYQIQEQAIDINENMTVKNAFMIDISEQKEAQSELIKSNVEFSLQQNELKKLEIELRELSNRDPLTNLYNRRYLSDISQDLLSLAKRNDTELSVLMIDIDKFKNINDTYGHDVGDEVIKLLSKQLIDFVRKSDVVARLGGEEFAIIFPNTDVDNAKNKAEEIRKEIELLTINLEDSRTILFTVSIGVSSFNKDVDLEFESILKKSDEALYEAKENGRNRVVLK